MALDRFWNPALGEALRARSNGGDRGSKVPHCAPHGSRAPANADLKGAGSNQAIGYKTLDAILLFPSRDIFCAISAAQVLSGG
jgi:hypothetical protein